MKYRILSEEYDKKFKDGLLPITHEFDITISCKSECYGASTKDKLTLKRMHNELILIGNSGSFHCSACYGG